MQRFWLSCQWILELSHKKQQYVPFLQRCRYFSFGTSQQKDHWDGASSFAVMSFGDGNHGALGLPSSVIGVGGHVYEPTRVPGLPSDVVSVSAGHYHSLAVTSQGELWAWGRNEEDQLGGFLPASSRCSWNEPKKVEGLSDVRVKAAYASGVVSAAIGDDGSLWVWGRSKRGQLGLGEGITQASMPSRVKALAGEEIAKVSLGWGHLLAQTNDGKLYGWGYSADGRLGELDTESSPLDSTLELVKRGDPHLSNAAEVVEKFVLESMEKENRMPVIWEPRLIEELQSIKVKDIACGLDHSLVLCCDGTLLSGGSNVYGQLGRAKEDMGFLPVDVLSHPEVIASGLGHSLAICDSEASSSDHEYACQVVSWGWNRNSQLGRAGPENQPLTVGGLEEELIISVSAGRAHSLALTANGELWVWGCGRNGRLGLGSSFDEPEPNLVDIEDCKVLQAAAGFDHSLVLVAEA